MGAEVDLDVVPLREADMEPFEILTSESQERMRLRSCTPRSWRPSKALCACWGFGTPR